MILASHGQGEAQGPCLPGTYTYTVTSYCSYPVWVGQHSVPSSQSYPPVGGNWALAPTCTASAQCGAGQNCVIPGGQTRGQCSCSTSNDCPGAAPCVNGLCSTAAVFCMPQTWTSGTFWPRTGCSLDGNGILNCQTGQCGTPGMLDCGFGNNGGSPQNPAFQFEVTTAPGGGNYDASINAGYNVQTKVTPVGGSQQGGACKFAGCTSDLNATCPAALRVISNGTVVGCLDPCTQCQRTNPAGLSCNSTITMDASGHQPSNTTNCMGQADGLPTYLDMYCAKNTADGNSQASSNQGTPTAFSQADCAVGTVFTNTGFPPSYTLPPGQGVCIDPNNPNYANALQMCGAATVGQACGGYLIGQCELPNGTPIPNPHGPGAFVCNADATCTPYGGLCVGGYADALGYTCQPVTANGMTAYACLPPTTTSGLGQCEISRGPATIGGSFPLYRGVGGVTNAAWITAGIQAGGGTTPYYQTFKAACPAAYTWQYDDAASGFACEGFTGFNIEFCGGGAVADDFNGDGKSDILWRDSSGNVAMWLMNGATIASSGFIMNVPTVWQPVGLAPAGFNGPQFRDLGDFNGDGRADILWWNTNTGDLALWLMNGITLASGSVFANVPAPWTPVRVGDFNGDRIADILWRNTSTGDVAMWLMSGTTILSNTFITTVLPLAWQPVRVGDFNGDGFADILWRNTSTGDVTIWLMNGATIASNSFIMNVPTVWQPVGVGDFNLDGKADILWWNSTTGDVALWFMNGTTITQNNIIATVPPPWMPVRVGDFNGDGFADILWRNTSTGDLSVWLMFGTIIGSNNYITTVPTMWTTQ